MRLDDPNWCGGVRRRHTSPTAGGGGDAGIVQSSTPGPRSSPPLPLHVRPGSRGRLGGRARAGGSPLRPRRCDQTDLRPHRRARARKRVTARSPTCGPPVRDRGFDVPVTAGSCATFPTATSVAAGTRPPPWRSPRRDDDSVHHLHGCASWSSAQFHVTSPARAGAAPGAPVSPMSAPTSTAARVRRPRRGRRVRSCVDLDVATRRDLPATIDEPFARRADSIFIAEKAP